MKPAPFEYEAPATVDEALDALAAAPDEARVLAGGQSLVALMNLRLASPSVIVDINGIGALAGIEERDGGVAIGAVARQADVERSDVVARRCPLLVDALRWVAHPQLRNRGTVVGSLVHHDPAAELPAVALALGARFTVCSRGGETRVVEAADFFLGHYATDVRPGELVTEAWFPEVAAGTGTAFDEVTRRQADFALVGVAVALEERDGVVERARLALCGMGDRPVRATAAEAALIGRRVDAHVLGEAADALAGEALHPLDDVHASAVYRLRVAPVVVKRALSSAHRRAS